MSIITPETQVVLMLCGVLPGAPVCDGAPLSPGDFHRLARWLEEQNISIASLVEEKTLSVVEEGVIEHQVLIDRLKALLNRGTATALVCERWLQMGLWIISPYDNAYPPRLKERLGDKSSPLLFGAGNVSLLTEGGIAIVGSRNADEAAQEFAQLLGARAAQQTVPVISGGARGVDAISMQGALYNGGTVVGVLANNLAREAAVPENRIFLQSERLILVSPIAPEAHFHAGNAMARNKYIYALADYSVVVSSDYGSGGTWSGSQENMKHEWCPLFVRNGEDIPEGNHRLIKRGAAPMERSVLDTGEDLLTWFENHAPVKQSIEQSSLFGESDAA